ncbi:I78 family peptidase inhibitor [Parasphingorhabdus cellanae]|uniref:Peptidase inhibitor I78 n=1 Tax=Parasphingorhabdus cellanae TaxID=2806553 RepID=A0ABX7T6Q4_9SPHN|nr:I78 family peptidase inhibitor [Parasphingorhabdus cellanae]QTD56816.1 peptidase inhibitor I78 [Parasphingorhabdus cellanae]
MKMQFALIALSCPAIMACSTTNPEPAIPERGVIPGYVCKTDDLETLVGQKATAEIAAGALKQSGAKRLRWIAPDTAVTMDFRQDRLNIEYDDEMVITRVNCG